jgi:hypothetical protein
LECGGKVFRGAAFAWILNRIDREAKAASRSTLPPHFKKTYY